MLRVTPTQEELNRRYEHSLVLAENWLNESSTHTQEKLAKEIGTDAGTLSRYLQRDPLSEPTPRRTKKIAILEGIETVCVTASDLEVNPVDARLASTSDADFDADLYREIRNRVINMLETTPSPRGIAQGGGLVTSAASSAEGHRPTNCQNVALAMAEQLAARHACISDNLVKRGVAMLRLLMTAASSVEGADHRILQLCRNYVGRGLAAAGRRLNDSMLRREGLEMLHDSVRLLPNSKPGDRIWDNYLDEIELLSQMGSNEAQDWSDKAHRLAEAQMGSDESLGSLVQKGLYSSILAFSLCVMITLCSMGPWMSNSFPGKSHLPGAVVESLVNGELRASRIRAVCGGGSVNDGPRLAGGGSVNSQPDESVA